MLFASEARRFLQALNGYLVPSDRSAAACMQQKCTANEARRACERAMDALEAHRIAHRC